MEFQIAPEFISGLVESDGCFCIIIEKRGKKEYFRPTFYITQQSPPGEKESQLLQKCAAYFGGGNWVPDKRTNCYSLRINSLSLLLNSVLPHFLTYPLYSEKARDMQTFTECCVLLEKGKKKSIQEQERLRKLALSMNKTSKRYKKESKLFSSLSGDDNKSICSFTPTKPSLPLHPQYVSGLIQGDGGFHFSFRRNPHRARPTFACGQHLYSHSLLLALQHFFSAGHIYQVKENHYRWSVDSLREIREQCMPHFEKYPLFGERAKLLNLFQKGCSLLGAPSLTRKERLRKIVHLLYNSNMGGKRRYLKKQDYLKECEKLP